MLAAGGFIASRWSNWFLTIVALGLFLNWLGDSLVSAVARHRSVERPRYGYFIDNSADLISQTLIIMGLGLSPYFTIGSALLVLSLYLLVSSYRYLHVVIQRARQLSYGGLGATELRLLVAGWSLFAAWSGPEIARGRLFSFVALDVVVGASSLFAFLVFLFIVRNDLARMRLEEKYADSDGSAERANDGVGLSFLSDAALSARRPISKNR